jgi:spermidine synthase
MVERLYLGLARSVSLSFLTFSLAQFLLVLALLLPPTTLMGATLPVLSRLFATESGTLGRRVGLLYALNTFGAVVGTALAGYVLLPTLGMQSTLILAAVVNLAVGAVIVLVDRRLAEESPAPSEVVPLPLPLVDEPSEMWPRRLTLLGLGLAGAASMIYEVAWTRALSLALGSSTYAFTAMLIAFLLGLALGSAIFSRLFGARPLGPTAFGLLQLGAGVAALGILPAFGRLPDAVVSALAISLSPAFVLFVQVALAVGAMLVPTLLIGAAFPCAVQVLVRGRERIARDVGRLYAVNTLGAIAGTVLAGFALIPLLGAQNTAKVAVLLNVGIGVALLATAFGVLAPWQRVTAGALALGGVLGLALIPAWNATVMAAGAAIYPRQYQRFAGQGGVARALADSRLVFYRDGLTATVSVHQEGPLTSLRVNGKTDASNGLDMHMQLMLGHLPLLARPEARSALVVGLGSGVTVGAVARHPLERIDVVEIEPAVVTAAGFFRKENRDALTDRRVHLAVGDARNFMLASERRWDVIVSEPSNPWIGGIATLFSEEFYALARSRLAPGGVMVQWVDGYTIRPEDLKMIVKTFRTAFPATTVWHAHGVADFILLGSADIQPFDLGRVQAAWDASPELREDFARMGFRTPWAFLADFLLTEIETARLSLGADLNDDDRLPLEFSAPKSLYRDTAMTNYRMVRAFRAAELPPLAGRGARHMDTPGARYDLGMAYLAKDLPAEAAVQLERAVAHDPAHVPSLIALGRALQRLDQPMRGIETLQTAARLDPRSAEAQAALARAWQAQRLTDRAIEAATVAVRLAPDDAGNRVLLGSLLEQQGKTAEAVEQYLAARQSRPRDAQLLESLATAYTRLGRFADAVTALEAALTLRPDDPALLARLGRAYLAVNQPIPAARVLTRSVTAAAQPAQTYADLGLARLGTGDPIGATVALEHAVALDPAHAGAAQLLGEINAKLYGAGAPR